jgi:serine/threonine-protein kinase HipA
VTPTTSLHVLLHGQVVAQLRAGPAMELRYTSDVVSALGVGALCLSAALPVAATPYRDSKPGTPQPRRAVEFWSEGLLPEGETRTLLERRFEVRRGDTIALLAAIGADCAGAVSFVTDTGSSSVRSPASGVPQPLNEQQLSEAVEALPSAPLGVGDRVRVSLGGMQAKLLLVRTPRGWTQPVDGQPSTHILKPDPKDLGRPGLVAAEALTLRAAALAGLAAAQVELVTVGGRLAVIVERYDRYRTGDGAVALIHQEDGCQALGLNPAYAKYQQAADAPPSYADLAGLLRTHAVDVDAELVALARQMILSWAVGNTDGHARNVSLLLTAGAARLAPAYDVAPTHLFTAGTDSGLWIDGQPRLHWITRAHVLREMSSWGIEPATAGQVLDSTLVALADALPRAAAQLGPLLPADLVEQTIEHLQQRAASPDS